MPTTVSWHEIAIRLILTLIAGGVIGIDRGEHGRPAGLRTTLLVCLAASIAMMQANLLMQSTGKASDSYVVLDLMRLPLGILSGMGFIGGGAILRKGDLVTGVTSAATLWFSTVMGLCFGGGQLGLGIAALVSGMLVLSALRAVDKRLPQEKRAILQLTFKGHDPDSAALHALIASGGFRVRSYGFCHEVAEGKREFQVAVSWIAPGSEPKLPAMIKELDKLPGVAKVCWLP